MITPRLISLDVFRGITIALMILVNSPGNLTPYRLFEHSIWNGCTLADLVFPFFIVIVGISSVLALSNLRLKGVSTARLFEKIIWRTAYIFLMGLFLNAFSRHVDISTLRIMGVLQRIAICYLFSAALFLTTQIRTQALIMLVLLLSYGCLMTCITPLDLVNMASHIDTLVFSSAHLYTPMFDPEGLLGTIPSIASVLLGNLIGAGLISSRTKIQRLQWMIIAGSILALLGWIWSLTLPLNKSLWSSSYVLWTGGLALLVYAALYALIEIKQWQYWSIPFDRLGRHAMLVYVLHILFLKIQAMIHLHNAVGAIVNLRLYITGILFSHLSPENAALSYAICYTMIWLLLLKVIETCRAIK